MAERKQKPNEAQPIEIEQIVARAVSGPSGSTPTIAGADCPACAGGVASSRKRSSRYCARRLQHSGSGSFEHPCGVNSEGSLARALLDSGSEHCSRIALFVVKAGAASGWQARGFGDEEAVKDFPLDLNAGPVAHTYHNRVATPGNIAEMGGQFVGQFGSPANEQVLVLPLALKDKVAALVYADGGDTGKLSSDTLELLVLATSAWLEVISLRKHCTEGRGRSGGHGGKSSPTGANRFFVFRSLCGARAQAYPREPPGRARTCGRSRGSGFGACSCRACRGD